MILYPTETLYALGVHALKEDELKKLFFAKGRSRRRVSSWLVRDLADIERYAELSSTARRIARRFLPGKLTLVLPARPLVPRFAAAEDGTIGFRISADPMAQEVIAAFMTTHGAPLTCTSANVSGTPCLPTVDEILQQFGDRAHLISEVHDGGVRKGLASTVVRVVGSEVTILREGDISEVELREVAQ